MNEDKTLREVPLTYAGQTSIFSGKLVLSTSDAAVLEVLAMDAGNANFGMLRRPLHVSE